ncbi:MAG: sugar/nucleoside kinase (ribokinase family) [Neolewinella sp.]|jgi:fructokinase
MYISAHLVCLTLGEKEYYVMYPEGASYLPARKVEVKDTTGAGDAF